MWFVDWNGEIQLLETFKHGVVSKRNTELLCDILDDDGSTIFECTVYESIEKLLRVIQTS